MLSCLPFSEILGCSFFFFFCATSCIERNLKVRRLQNLSSVMEGSLPSPVPVRRLRVLAQRGPVAHEPAGNPPSVPQLLDDGVFAPSHVFLAIFYRPEKEFVLNESPDKVCKFFYLLPPPPIGTFFLWLSGEMLRSSLCLADVTLDIQQ